jgi:hypothetical protein
MKEDISVHCDLVGVFMIHPEVLGQQFVPHKLALDGFGSKFVTLMLGKGCIAWGTKHSEMRH